MFSKILIANRGEIACRVIRSARRMGITTVAVYSQVDRDALHVREADEAICIGGETSAESYLRHEAIIDACKASGAEAVHPGYGFLSENADFAGALAEAGIVFIGPKRPAIEAMGDKITSKRIAEQAGVNVIPGFTDVVRDADHAASIAEEIGYPVMLKASAGGGGKGMRVAYDEAQCREGFERASSEARSSFGDDRVFIEKFIEQPRHIEIQVLADQHGNVLYLGERECSIQRRHQKVVEEAPSPLIDEATRSAMGEQAVALARAVDYISAGTVEFVADAERNFYFLEMNTRLQVEHPVTEMVTGLDLVEQMIRIAAGESLTLAQTDVQLNGWALECRIYAEDPLRGFLPSTGRVVRYLEPRTGPNVRVDSGLAEGGEVSMYYDPLVSKLIAYAPERSVAIDVMRKSLDAYFIRGIQTNIAFLSSVMNHARFCRGDLTTHFIAEEYGDGFSVTAPHGERAAQLAAVAAVIHCRHEAQAIGIRGQVLGTQYDVASKWVVRLAECDHGCEVQFSADTFRVLVDERPVEVVSDWLPGAALFTGTIDSELCCIQVERDELRYRLVWGGVGVEALVLNPRAAAVIAHMPVKVPPDMSAFLLSPMPGLLLSVNVAEGEAVKAGQELAVIEAMKMENVMRCDRDRVIKALLAQPGESLAVDQKILEFE